MLNSAIITGRVLYAKESHISHRNRMYEMKLEVERNSGRTDEVIVYYDDKFIYKNQEYATVCGTLRETPFGSDSIITVNAHEIYFADDMNNVYPEEINSVELEGVVAFVGHTRYAKGVPFKTVVINCTRDNGYAKDTLATAFWGQYALDVSENDIGSMVYVTGRLQNKKHGNQVSTRRVEWK